MNKRHSLNLGAIICLAFASYLLYYILLHDNLLPFSIHSVLLNVNHLAKNWHVIVIGLLPIYLALMVFGTAILGIYFGSALQRWIGSFLKVRS